MIDNSDKEYFKKDFMKWFYPKDNVPEISESQVENSFKIISRMRTHDVIAKYNHNVNFEKEVKNLRCPMLIIHGTHDPMFLFEGTIDYKNINNSKLSIVGLVGAGHIPSKSHMKEIKSKVSDFI